MTDPVLPRSLAHVRDWVFDLDNTLYPRTCNLFAQVDALMTRYVMDLTGLPLEEARVLQKRYYREHGTTLRGLMDRHAVDPDHFLQTVHAIDYASVLAHPQLVRAIECLPGRKFILTNGDLGHAHAVLERLGAAHLFAHVHDIRAMAFSPKPLAEAYHGFFQRHAIAPEAAAMFDDLEKNLVVPHEVGMVTVQVVPGADFIVAEVAEWELERSGGAHVHHLTADLAGFLADLP